jgi:hypothetical protein
MMRKLRLLSYNHNGPIYQGTIKLEQGEDVSRVLDLIRLEWPRYQTGGLGPEGNSTFADWLKYHHGFETVDEGESIIILG